MDLFLLAVLVGFFLLTGPGEAAGKSLTEVPR